MASDATQASERPGEVGSSVAGTTRGSGLRALAIVAVVILGLSWIRLSPGNSGGQQAGGFLTESGEVLPGEPGTEGEFVVDEQGRVVRRTVGGGSAAGTAGTAGRAGGRSGAGSGLAGGGSGSGGAGSNPDGSPLECKAGRNGGATDTGVSAAKIRLATTAVLDGPAKSLLEPSVTGIRAVVNTANQGGGICGRLLELTVKNDSFRSDLGQQYIRNFIAEAYFALPVVPSAEGLGAAILSGDIQAAGIPVVGTDGMREEQYDASAKAGWVWPVATATISTMRIMAKYGYVNKGALTFAIVWDQKYKFGIEGHDAFVDQVGKLGGTVVADQPLNPDSSSYAGDVQSFNGKCGANQCDMVALLLLPDTARNWMVRTPAIGAKYTAGAQTLFTDDFANKCTSAAGQKCHGMAVWTGYVPPIDHYAGIPDVSDYQNAVTSASPGIDVRNQFLEGAYLGTTLFVDALKKTGPNLTRARLREVLDVMDFGNQITAGLSWRPGKHFANVRARSFSIVVSGSDFRGWRDEQTGWVVDPAFGG